MLLSMLVNAVWCEVTYLLEAQEAGAAYADCLNAAQGAEANAACFLGFLEAVGNATIELFACVY
ncbi:MAG: hypothetical protein IT185_05675 [Acidobacteria bacterium]|jgi:hypothetical protein|nr:hypothetical protein [Acidobacteriota bacterium]